MQTRTTFMAPPPAATFLAFHPQDNNIIAIRMDDSTIQIYNVHVDEVKSKLKGHSKKITGLAFSHVLNVVVSSGAECVKREMAHREAMEKAVSRSKPLYTYNESARTRAQEQDVSRFKGWTKDRSKDEDLIDSSYNR
ncbi:topless-like protein [Tanacetum coccineum]